MKLAGLLLFAVVGWTGLGGVGIVLSLARHRRSEAVKHAAWLAAVPGLYLAVLLSVSVVQRQRLVRPGEDQCFNTMCFAVAGFDEMPGLIAGESSRVVRVAIRVSNRSDSARSDSHIRAYLVDQQGRAWEPLAGLSGNRLTARVAGRSEMISQPMFRVAGDSESLGLILTRGNWQPGRLTIADRDSLGHKPTIVPLEK